MIRRSSHRLLVAPALSGRHGRSQAGPSGNNRKVTPAPGFAPLVRTKLGGGGQAGSGVSARPIEGCSEQKQCPSGVEVAGASMQGGSVRVPRVDNLQPHERRLLQILTSAFPVATVKFIGKQLGRVGTEADFLYAAASPRDANAEQLNHGLATDSKQDTQRSAHASGLGDERESSGSAINIATLGGRHDNSTPIRTLSELIQRNQAGFLVSGAEAATDSIPPWSSGSYLVDYARFCSIGPIVKGVHHSDDGNAPAQSALPPLYAPRLNARRLALEAVVFLPGFHPSDLKKVVARNLLKHLSKLDPVIQAEGKSGQKVRRGLLSHGFDASKVSMDGKEASKPQVPTPLPDGTATQKRILDNDYMFEQYGVRVLSDCIEIVVEADVPVLRCPMDPPLLQHEEGAPTIAHSEDVTQQPPSSSLEVKYTRLRRTMYVGFASPSWDLAPLRTRFDEEERHAVRVACGVSRETLRRSLPTPVLEAANLLNAYARDVCDRVNSSRRNARLNNEAREAGDAGAEDGRSSLIDDAEEDDNGLIDGGARRVGVAGRPRYQQQVEYLVAPSSMFWLHMVLLAASRVNMLQCSILNELLRKQFSACSTPPAPSPWALSVEPLQGPMLSGSPPHEPLFPLLQKHEEIQQRLSARPTAATQAPHRHDTDESAEGAHDIIPLSQLFEKEVSEGQRDATSIQERLRNLTGQSLLAPSYREEEMENGEGAVSGLKEFVPPAAGAVFHTWRNLEWLRLRALAAPAVVSEMLSNSPACKVTQTRSPPAAVKALKQLRDSNGDHAQFRGYMGSHLRQLAAIQKQRRRALLGNEDDLQMRDSESVMMASLLSLSGYNFPGPSDNTSSNSLPVDAYGLFATLTGRGNLFYGHDDATASEVSIDRLSVFSGNSDSQQQRENIPPNQRLQDLHRMLAAFNTDHMMLQNGSPSIPFDGPNHFNVATTERDLRLMSASLADAVASSMVKTASVSESHLLTTALTNTTMLPVERFMSTNGELMSSLAAVVEVCRSLASAPPNFLAKVAGEMQA